MCGPGGGGGGGPHERVENLTFEKIGSALNNPQMTLKHQKSPPPSTYMICFFWRAKFLSLSQYDYFFSSPLDAMLSLNVFK